MIVMAKKQTAKPRKPAPKKPAKPAEDERDRVAREAARESGDGELRDIHSPVANDQISADSDEDWLANVEQRATEGGPLPEHEVDITDDEENGRRDR